MSKKKTRTRRPTPSSFLRGPRKRPVPCQTCGIDCRNDDQAQMVLVEWTEVHMSMTLQKRVQRQALVPGTVVAFCATCQQEGKVPEPADRHWKLDGSGLHLVSAEEVA